MSSHSLPSLAQITASSPEDQNSALVQTLSALFESSPVLLTHLVPQLIASFNNTNTESTTQTRASNTNAPTISSYTSLIDLALHTITSSSSTLQSTFISGHPRIGQVKNLSELSTSEQARYFTPPEVISRLEYLNRCYERRYPGLRYITFVNGRTRTEVMVEMERFLGVQNGSGTETEEPDFEAIDVFSAESKEWRDELDRAIEDIGLIAKSRLTTFGVK